MAEINFNSFKSFDGVVSEAEYNRLVDLVQSLTLTNGVNYTLLRTPAGTTIRPNGKGAIGGASCPFTVTLRPGATETTRKAVVSYGTVNQLVPTNILDEHTIDATGLYYVKLVAVSDGEKITSSTIEVDGTAATTQSPTPFALPATVEITLAVIKDAKIYRTLGCGSIVLTGHEEFRTDKSPPAQPGEMVYTPYYVWALST